MADGRDPTSASNCRSTYLWTEIFRCFQIALDPRKLLVAALGIFAMSILWWLLSVIFWYKGPDPNADRYSAEIIKKEFDQKKTNPQTGQEFKNNELDEAVALEKAKRFEADSAQWRTLDSLAGPGGRLRTLPWYEYRGPNPFLFITTLISAPATSWWEMSWVYLKTVAPVLLEPLVKLLLPVAKLVSPGVSGWTRLYLLLILLSNVAIWAFCGGIITRIAAVQLANKGPISLKQAVQFVTKRYLAYIGAPLVPLAIIAACAVGLILYGIVGLIPLVGDLVIFGIGLPIIIIGGAVMAVFLIGLVGYPLMYPTLSAEGDQSDTFDALSRSINYVYQSPWHYIWYWLVAIVYGAAVTFFVLFFTSLMVYVGKWAVSIPASIVWSDRKPDYLFIYAPESFGWRELLTKDSPYAVRQTTVYFDREGKETTDPRFGRAVIAYRPVDEAAFKQARSQFYAYNTWAAGIVCLWLTLMFLMMLGFSYSFFWCAATMIYLLMRKKVDEAELDEVFTEDDEPEPPLAPPKIAEGTGAAGPTALPVIESPPVPPLTPPVAVSPPPTPLTPATTLPYTPPPPPPEQPKKSEDEGPLG